MNGAACAEAPPRLFFDFIWADDATAADPDELEFVRNRYCRTCPARRACLEYAMEYEDQLSNDADRFGLSGYLTPAQRRSVKKRRALRCHDCGTVRDPVDLEKGIYRCATGCCANERQVDPIPIEGDQWTKRHTTLARKVVTWIADHVEVGQPSPSVIRMSELLGARRQDMARVYAALVADGTLDREGLETTPTYRRRRSTGATWTPRFLPD